MEFCEAAAEPRKFIDWTGTKSPIHVSITRRDSRQLVERPRDHIDRRGAELDTFHGGRRSQKVATVLSFSPPTIV